MGIKDNNRTTDQIIRNAVERTGCFIGYLKTDNYNPAYGFTVGLWQSYGHPEIIVFGLPERSTAQLLHTFSKQIRAGKALQTKVNYVLHSFDRKLQFLDVAPPNKALYSDMITAYYDHTDFEMMQLVWADSHAQFPWDDEFQQEFRFAQPLLDRNLNYQYLEDPNLAVYITKAVLEENKKVTYVLHDDDGEWMFSCGSTNAYTDLIRTPLNRLIEMQPDLNSLFNLPYGYHAWRQPEEGTWRREEMSTLNG